MAVISLILYILSTVIIISLFKSKVLKWMSAILFVVFFVLQLLSLYLGGEFVDYRFYVHFTPNSLLMAGGYKKQVFWTIFILITMPIVLCCFADVVKKLENSLPGKYVIATKMTILLLTLFVLWLPERSMFHKLKGMPVFILSGGTNTVPYGPNSIIAVDGKNYSRYGRGLNIVIFNRQTQKVQDSFSVDTFEDKNLKIVRDGEIL
ncbi:MAG: hypothetical protein LBT04_08820 [Prevotellaceae bacterium]|jgi:hypothetical protein|nr:hypothetical protein [Prevotellaceae bacterium]